jgi:hypothetical protein
VYKNIISPVPKIYKYAQRISLSFYGRDFHRATPYENLCHKKKEAYCSEKRDFAWNDMIFPEGLTKF